MFVSWIPSSLNAGCNSEVEGIFIFSATPTITEPCMNCVTSFPTTRNDNSAREFRSSRVSSSEFLAVAVPVCEGSQTGGNCGNGEQLRTEFVALLILFAPVLSIPVTSEMPSENPHPKSGSTRPQLHGTLFPSGLFIADVLGMPSAWNIVA